MAEMDYAKARATLIEEAKRLDHIDEPPEKWVQAVERLSDDCEAVNIRSHIAFLGTAILAKATNPSVDVYSVKVKAGGEGAYSARGVVKILVEEAHGIGVHLGATGREPLNNQPYFRIDRATKESLLDAAKGASTRPIETLMTILSDLEDASEGEALDALRAFIEVRRRYKPTYATIGAVGDHRVRDLVSKIHGFVSEKSEGGRRAQAAAAGVMDSVFGHESVAVERINAPDRRVPGDVGIMGPDGESCWKVVEVRDKPIIASDVLRAAHKAAKAGTPVVGVLGVARGQGDLNDDSLASEAAAMGVELELFVGWDEFVRSALFWAARPVDAAVEEVFAAVHRRLIQVEASGEAVESWVTLTTGEGG